MNLLTNFKDEVKQTREAFIQFRIELHNKPEWVINFFKRSNGLDARIEKLERAIAIQEQSYYDGDF